MPYSAKQSQVFLWLLILALLGIFLFVNWPFLTPVLLAAIFAMGLHDFISSLASKLKIPQKLMIFVTLLAGLTIFWVILSLAGYRVFLHLKEPQQIEKDHVLSQLQTLKVFALDMIQKISGWTGVDLANPSRELLETTLRRVGQTAFEISSNFFSRLPSFLLASFAFFVILLSMLLSGPFLKDFTLRYSPFSRELTESLVHISKASCKLTLFSTLVVGLVQASIIGLGSLIFNQGDFWLVLTITFVFSFIPVIGAAPVGYILSLLAYLGDRPGAAAGLLVIAIIAGVIDNLLKPYILGRENKLSAVVGFTCVVGAVLMLGLPGLLIGPVVANLVSQALPILIKNNRLSY